MRTLSRTMLLLCAAAAPGACAGVTVVPARIVDAQAPDGGREQADLDGIRFTRTATYILIKPDYTKRKADVTFWSGPDTSQIYSAAPHSFMASNTTKLEFKQGVLASASSHVDTTKLPAAIAGHAADVIKGALEVAAAAGRMAPLGGVGADESRQIPIFLFMVTDRGIEQIPLPISDAAPEGVQK